MIKKVGVHPSVASTLSQQQLPTSFSNPISTSKTKCANPVPNLFASSGMKTSSQTTIKTSISPRELPGCSSTGPHLGVESAPFSSSSPYSSSYLCATRKTNVPQEKQEEQRCMSWSPLLQEAVDNPLRRLPLLPPRVDIPGLDQQVPMPVDFHPHCPMSVEQACSNFTQAQQPSLQVLARLPSVQPHQPSSSLASTSQACRESTIILQPCLLYTSPSPRDS